MQISYHSVLTKIQKLQNLKKKKKLFSVLAGTPGTGRYCPKLAGTAGIFSGTKQGGRAYRIAGRYGIFRPYRQVRYGIDNLAFDTYSVQLMRYFFSNYTPNPLRPDFFHNLYVIVNVYLSSDDLMSSDMTYSPISFSGPFILT